MPDLGAQAIEKLTIAFQSRNLRRGSLALSTEMVEDSFVDPIYGHMYGWRTLTYALITASLTLTAISTASVHYALPLLVQNLDLVRKGSAVLLGLVGLFWLVTSTLWPERESELEEARSEKSQKGKEDKNELCSCSAARNDRRARNPPDTHSSGDRFPCT